MATIASNVIVQQPQVSTVATVRSNQWSTGLWGCFDDCSICCFATWCPFCFACATASDFGECFCLPMMDVFVWGPPPVSMALRASVRNKYGIQGDLSSDCMYVTFCNMCSWCQIARELKRRNANIIVVNAQPAVIAAPVVAAPVVMAAPVLAPAPCTVMTSQVTTVSV